MQVVVVVLFFAVVMMIVRLKGETLFQDEGAFGVHLRGELVEGLEKVFVGAIDVEVVVVCGRDDCTVGVQLQE